MKPKTREDRFARFLAHTLGCALAWGLVLPIAVPIGLWADFAVRHLVPSYHAASVFFRVNMAYSVAVCALLVTRLVAGKLVRLFAYLMDVDR